MRRWLGLSRGAVRGVACALLCALTVSTLGPVLHGAHDPDYEPLYLAHDERDHGVRAPASALPGDADHCVACHFSRSSRGPIAWEPNGLHDLAAGLRLALIDRHAVAALRVPPRPARAPPRR